MCRLMCHLLNVSSKAGTEWIDDATRRDKLRAEMERVAKARGESVVLKK